MGSAGCRRSTATSPIGASSRATRSATSISTSPRSGPSRASSTCSSPSTALRSSPFVELHEKATTRVSADFLRRLLEAVPYKVHTVLTDNGIQFTTPGAGGSAVPEIQEALAKGELFRAHAFELACAKAGIDHRTT